MFHDVSTNKDKLLKILYEWRRETMAESVCVHDLSAKVGLEDADIQSVLQDLLEIGYVKTGTPVDPSQISTWVKITKAGRDYLREKAIVD